MLCEKWWKSWKHVAWVFLLLERSFVVTSFSWTASCLCLRISSVRCRTPYSAFSSAISWRFFLYTVPLLRSFTTKRFSYVRTKDNSGQRWGHSVWFWFCLIYINKIFFYESIFLLEMIQESLKTGSKVLKYIQMFIWLYFSPLSPCPILSHNSWLQVHKIIVVF